MGQIVPPPPGGWKEDEPRHPVFATVNCLLCGAPPDPADEHCRYCGVKYRLRGVDWSVHYPVPQGVEKIVMFDDIASRRVMLLAKWGEPGALWLFYWHKHGANWVSLREATQSDRRALIAAIQSQGALEIRLE